MADTAITIAATRTTPLSEQERAATGYNTKYRVLYSDIAYGTGSSDTVTMTLGSTPTNWYIDKAMVQIRTAFAGTTALALIVGTTSSTAAAIASASVLTAGMLPPAAGAPVSTNLKGTAAVSLVATFTNATGGSPSALTAGDLDIYLNIQNVADLSR
jgi:hypothetical protein